MPIRIFEQIEKDTNISEENKKRRYNASCKTKHVKFIWWRNRKV